MKLWIGVIVVLVFLVLILIIVGISRSKKKKSKNPSSVAPEVADVAMEPDEVIQRIREDYADFNDPQASERLLKLRDLYQK
jgi:hypothetical protein